MSENNVLPFARRPAQIGSLATLDHPISKGATGNDVRDLQRQLYAWGFTPGAFDGVYGSKTASAVAELQKILRLPMDGVFGPNTLKAVNDDLAQPRSMLNDREAQFINRPPPQAPAAVTAQVPPQLTPSAIVPASAVATSVGPAPVTPTDQKASGVPWLWLLLGGAALVGLILVVKGSGGLGEADTDTDADADNFFEHDALLGVPQPRKRARRRNEDGDDTPDDTKEPAEDEGEEDNEEEEKAS